MTTATPTEIGNRIRTTRKKKGLSQTELANLLGKSMRTIQKYESGEIEPSIAIINEIAKRLDVESAYLMGYGRTDNTMDTLSDVMALIAELSDKAGIRFEVDVKRPPHAEEWSCAIRFNGNQADAEHNADLCLFLESFRDERERLETYWSDRAQYDEWLDHQLAYYAPIPLADRERETLTPEERIRRRDTLVAQQVEQAKQKAVGLETDSEN